MLGPSVEQIATMLHDRMQLQGPIIENMRQLRDTYNGDLVIPLPEMDKRQMFIIQHLKKVTQHLKNAPVLASAQHLDGGKLTRCQLRCAVALVGLLDIHHHQ